MARAEAAEAAEAAEQAAVASARPSRPRSPSRSCPLRRPMRCHGRDARRRVRAETPDEQVVSRPAGGGCRCRRLRRASVVAAFPFLSTFTSLAVSLVDVVVVASLCCVAMNSTPQTRRRPSRPLLFAFMSDARFPAVVGASCVRVDHVQPRSKNAQCRSSRSTGRVTALAPPSHRPPQLSEDDFRAVHRAQFAYLSIARTQCR